MRSFAKKLGYKTVMERNYFEFEVNGSLVNMFRELDSHDQYKELHELSKNDIVEFMLSGKNVASIIPKKMIVVNWEPYEIMQSNVDFIFKEGDKMFVDLSTEELKHGKMPRSFSHAWYIGWCLA
jgi:hypothetical protein